MTRALKLGAVGFAGSRARAFLACCSASSKRPSLYDLAVSFSSFLALILLANVQPAEAATNRPRIAVAPIRDQENFILLAPLIKDKARRPITGRFALQRNCRAKNRQSFTTADRRPANQPDSRRHP